MRTHGKAAWKEKCIRRGNINEPRHSQHMHDLYEPCDNLWLRGVWVGMSLRVRDLSAADF